MRVLVTGAAGYLGRAVVERLAGAGHEPVGLAHRRRPDIDGISWRTADLLDAATLPAAVAGVDAVVHLAAVTGVRDAFARPLRHYQVNVGGTVNLLDALAERGGPRRFVFASTTGVYGAPVRQPIDESVVPAPTNPYAASKLAAEQAVGWQTAAGELGAVTLRLGNAAGAIGTHGDTTDSRVITRMCAVAAGRVRTFDVFGDGGAIRDFVHIDDIATALVAALDVCVTGRHRVINIGATPASVAEIISVVREVTGRHIPVAYHAAHAGEVRELWVDIAVAMDLLKWRPRRSLLRGLVADQWRAEQAAGAGRQQEAHRPVGRNVASSARFGSVGE